MLVIPKTLCRIQLPEISPLKLKAIKKCISLYFQYIESRYRYSGFGKEKQYHIYHFYAFDKSLTETNPLVSNFCIQIKFDTVNGGLFFQLTGEKRFVETNEQIVSDVAPSLAKYVESVIVKIIQLIQSAQIVKRTVRTIFKLRYMDFSGSYSFGDMSVDFGKQVGDFQDGKFCLCEFPYEVICIQNNNLIAVPSVDNAFESVEQYKQLIQFFLRATVEENNFINVDLDKVDSDFKSEEGKQYKEELNLNSILPYTSFERNHLGLPSHLPSIYESFNRLSYTLKSSFLDSCSMYSRALVASPNEAVTYLVIVLENLCKDLYPSIKDSHKKFRKVFFEYCTLSNEKKSLEEKYYAVRCSFAHNAVMSQNPFQLALNEFEVSKKDVLLLERIVYIAMISWIGRKSDES